MNASQAPGSPTPGGFFSPSNRPLNLYQSTQQQPPAERETGPTPLIGFISVNRVVSVLEKAIERLELLTLLDTTAPQESPGPLFPSIGGTSAAKTEMQKAAFATRKAAVLLGREEESRRTVRDLNTALQSTTSTQWGGRPTVADLVAEQQQLELRYSDLLRRTAKVQPNPNEPELDRQCFESVHDEQKMALLEELKRTSRRLREHNKALFIQLKDNPNDADNWKKIGNERKELIQLLAFAVRELTTGYTTAKPANSVSQSVARTSSRLRSAVQSECQTVESKEGAQSLMKNRFGSTVQMRRASRSGAAPRIPMVSTFEKFAKLITDEQNAQRWADELVLKEKELNQNVKQLQHDLKTEKILKEKDVTERQQRVAELKIQLRHEKRRVQEQNDMVRAEVEAAHEAMHRRGREEERVVREAMRANEVELAMEEQAHADFKDHLIERTEAMDELAMQWDKKNQVEVKRVEARKIDVEQMRQQCAERLERAMRDKETELGLKLERDTEQQQIETEKTEAERQSNLEYEATSKIQSAIRAMFTRQALIVLKKKNKKKKKAAN